MKLRIESHRKRMVISERGEVFQVRRISFATERGHHTHIDVPIDATEQEIKAAMETEARLIDGLSS